MHVQVSTPPPSGGNFVGGDFDSRDAVVQQAKQPVGVVCYVHLLQKWYWCLQSIKRQHTHNWGIVCVSLSEIWSFPPSKWDTRRKQTNTSSFSRKKKP